jgi:uncharacterized protein YbjT (DUF2867 family)
MKAVILGASGMIGKAVLLECLGDPRVTSVLSISRSPCGIEDVKLREIIHSDFLDFNSLTGTIKGYDSCFYCAGVTVAGLSEAQYRRVTFDMTLAFAKVMLDANPDSVFCYVSGAGTDSTEIGRTMWARVKGQTENAILALPFRASYMFRPGYIQPLKGVRSRTVWYNLVYLFLKPLYFVLRPFKGFVTDSVTLGKAMIASAATGYPGRILESRDINELGSS